MAEETCTATIGITEDVRHPNLSIPGVRANMNFLECPEFTVKNLPTWRVEELREMGFSVKVEEETSEKTTPAAKPPKSKPEPKTASASGDKEL